MPKMTGDQAVQKIKDLLGAKEQIKSAPAMRDALIEIAGDRTKLVQMMDAVTGLPKLLTEDK